MGEYQHVIEAGIETIAHGEIISQTDYQIAKAIANCLDPNTDAKATRTVTVKITIKPDEKRTSAVVAYAVDLKLPSDATGVDQIMIRQSDARGFVPKFEQLGLDALVEDAEKIVDIDDGKVSK